MISHYAPKFSDDRPDGSGYTMVLVCHVILQDHVT